MKKADQAKPTVESLLAIKTDRMDRNAFKEIQNSKVSQLTQIDRTTNSIQQVEAEACVQDVFSSLYKSAPQIQQSAPKLQRDLASQIMKLPEYQNLHAMTQMDEISSAFGTLQLGPSLLKVLHEAKQRASEQQKKKSKSQPQKDQHVNDKNPEDMMPAGNQSSDGQGDQESSGDEEGGGSDSGDAEGPGLEDLFNDDEMSWVRNAVRASLKEAAENCEEWETTMRAWGVDPAELKKVPFEKRFELAEKLLGMKKFQQISDLAGRFKNVVNAHHALVPKHGNDEIVDIGLGRDLARLIPSEMMKLEITPLLFYKDFAEGNLLQYELQGVEAIGRGPLIICCDHSGSMTGARDEFAKGVVLALISLAEKQKRAFGFLAFNTDVMYKEFFPRGEKVSLDTKIDIASLGPEGGTNFYEPLIAAFQLRIKDPQLKPADIVFVTDDDCALDSKQLKEILKLKQETEVRIFGVAINDASRYGDGCSGKSLKSFCDDIAVVNSLGEIQYMVDIVKQTASGSAQKSKKKVG
jgi:uncharacterized protein with von Willebrand factor type A (vWA) domain